MEEITNKEEKEILKQKRIANAIAEGTMPYWNIFGLQVAQAGYPGSVLPVLAVSYILANLENFFHKRRTILHK